MNGLPFLLAFLGAFAAMLAGCEGVRVGRLSAALGAGAGLVAACWLACAAGSAAAAWIGWWIAAIAPQAAATVAAVVLVAAAGELLLLRPGATPVEPTRSFGAIALVLSGAQLISAASAVILAVTLRAGAPEAAAFGGMLGAGAVLTAAWKAGAGWERRMPRGILRWCVAGVLLFAALAG